MRSYFEVSSIVMNISKSVIEEIFDSGLKFQKKCQVNLRDTDELITDLVTFRGFEKQYLIYSVISVTRIDI